MTASDIAQRLLAARRTRRPIAAAEHDGPQDIATAHDVQWTVTRALAAGQRVAHWKVGAATCDETPLAAPIPPPRVLPSPARWIDGPVSALSIEAEVAFRVARDIDTAQAATLTPAQAFDRVLVTIEVCDTRLADANPAPMWKLADSLSNAGLVVGAEGVAPNAVDYAALHCEVQVDGVVAFDGTGTHPLRDPRVLLPWFLTHAVARAPLRAGDIVTTGSWCGMLPVRAGSRVVVRFAGVGSAEVTFAD
jgi:2-keto-4-pentenoate hydratase